MIDEPDFKAAEHFLLRHFPDVKVFTFILKSDRSDSRPPLIMRCTLEAAWPVIRKYNTLEYGYGVFIEV
jgi:hypothetical protein